MIKTKLVNETREIRVYVCDSCGKESKKDITDCWWCDKDFCDKCLDPLKVKAQSLLPLADQCCGKCATKIIKQIQKATLTIEKDFTIVNDACQMMLPALKRLSKMDTKLGNVADLRLFDIYKHKKVQTTLNQVCSELADICDFPQ